MAWTAPRSWVTGELVTASMFNVELRDNFRELWHDVDHTAVTSPVSITSTSSGTPTSVISGASTSGWDGSKPALIEFFCPQVEWSDGNAGDVLTFLLFEDSTDKGRIAQLRTNSVSNRLAGPVKGEARLTPASGSHTYSVKAYRSGAAANTAANAGAAGSDTLLPMFLRVQQKG